MGPFGNVDFGGKKFRVGQGNNVFIFPGVGLAAILVKVDEVTIEMFTIASHALAECVTDDDLHAGAVFPKIGELCAISTHVAIFVLKGILAKNPDHHLHGYDLDEYVEACMWKTQYLPYRRV